MVNKTGKNYQCEECGLKYEKKKFAKKCEEWCRKHNSCNLEITKHATNRNRVEKKLEKIAAKGGFIGGIASGILGFLGIIGLCCSPLVLTFLGVFGISSGMFLMTYKYWLLFISGLFFIITIFIWWKYG